MDYNAITIGRQSEEIKERMTVSLPWKLMNQKPVPLRIEIQEPNQMNSPVDSHTATIFVSDPAMI